VQCKVISFTADWLGIRSACHNDMAEASLENSKKSRYIGIREGKRSVPNAGERV
jgi:hypothetical protein